MGYWEDRTQAPKHDCYVDMPTQGCGAAIEYCCSDDTGRLWVGNGEYNSQVLFCPFCGEKAYNDSHTADS